MPNYGTIDSSAHLKVQDAIIDECASFSSCLREDTQTTAASPSDGITTRHLIALYLSHGLFMWNNRCYEFAAVLFTASAFPHTLVEASIRALGAHLASFMFAPVIGRWLSRHAIARWPVQGCIVVQRISITLASFGWTSLMPISVDGGNDKQVDGVWKPVLLAILILLGMLERLSAVGNLVIVEREWLPSLSTLYEAALVQHDGATRATPTQHETPSNLHVLNAAMKRIDLATKLVAPLAVSRLAIHTNSLHATGLILALLQPFSGGVELYLTDLIWRHYICDHTVGNRTMASPLAGQRRPEESEVGSSVVATNESRGLTWIIAIMSSSCISGIQAWYSSFASYLRHRAALPSLAYALEPLSVLTLAGSMTAYLLAANFSLSEITLARSASTAIDIASTVLTPLMVSCAMNRSKNKAAGALPALVKVGVIGLSWQLLCLLPVTATFIAFPSLDGSDTETHHRPIIAIIFGGLVLSRLGPFAYSLVEQQIVQVKVDPSDRVAFSSVETALFDMAELARWCMLMVFSTTQSFRWVALLSFAAILCSWLMLLRWAQRLRCQA
ncbi:hypothetical protein M409DRAFT_30558 [Zasmidium cellare ATCC 36951]|uniref:Solute carrier family 40 member n=1 Tax=Zasmidium cellare ATCC 36951 TaxID=1080233 RepID=A0A6A6BWQ8_ZASCE|nr:uncharacterized protein M409DRAFT_30558 [Zasmidium cellare ATCC 36951]KAF2159023.1 hypothetical protein M409DRAFT_30558 [Zasmidium cellare ATCC 36951]